MSGFEIAVKPLYERLVKEGFSKRDALYEAIRAAMLAGAVPEGTRLPATRRLAGAFGVSRGVAAAAYDMLHAEVTCGPPSGRGRTRHTARRSAAGAKELRLRINRRKRCRTDGRRGRAFPRWAPKSPPRAGACEWRRRNACRTISGSDNRLSRISL